MDFFLTVHQYLRFVILAVALLGILRSVVSLGTREAIFVAHLSRRYREWPDRERLAAHLRIYLGSLVLIGIGLLVIGQLRLM